MAAPRAKRARSGFRVTLQLTFDEEAASSAFKAKLQRMKEVLAPNGYPPLDNVGLLSRLIEIVESQRCQWSADSTGTTSAATATVNQHLLPSAGIMYN